MSQTEWDGRDRRLVVLTSSPDWRKEGMLTLPETGRKKVHFSVDINTTPEMRKIPESWSVVCCFVLLGCFFFSLCSPLCSHKVFLALFSHSSAHLDRRQGCENNQSIDKLYQLNIMHRTTVTGVNYKNKAQYSEELDTLWAVLRTVSSLGVSNRMRQPQV